MDIKTAEAVDSLRTDIHHVEAEVQRVETSLTAKMNETRRHTDVQFESVRDDIRMVAEAVVALGDRVDSLRR